MNYEPTVSCIVTTLTLPRVMPSQVCVSWRCKEIVGKTEAFQGNVSSTIQINQGFEVRKDRDEKLSIIVAVHAINKKGFSIKFSEKEILIPEQIYSQKSSYQHANISSTIGDFLVEVKFAAKNVKKEENWEKSDEKIEEYVNIIKSISAIINTSSSNDKYLRGASLIREISKFPASALPEEKVKNLSNALAELQNKNRQINIHCQLIVDTIMAMMEKGYMYITKDGKVSNYGNFHNLMDTRYPLVGVIASRGIAKLFNEENMFDPAEIDQYMLEVCSLFAGMLSNCEKHDRGLMYLICNLAFIHKYKTVHIKQDLESFMPVLFMTYKQVISRMLEFDKEQIDAIGNNSRKFISWYKDHCAVAFDMSMPGEAIALIHNYILDMYDIRLYTSWINDPNPPEPNFSDLFKAIPYKWIHAKALMFIVQNAEKIIKRKVTKQEIPDYLRGSFFMSIIKKLESMKKISPSARQLNAITDPDIRKSTIPSIIEYIEDKCTIGISTPLPDVLPTVREYF